MADKKHDKEAKKDPKVVEGAAPEGAEDAPKRPSGLFALLKAVGFVAVIVLVEVVAASMLIPSPQDTERTAKQYVAASSGDTAVHGEEADEHGEGEHGEEVEEVELGTFNVTHYNPNTNTTLSIDFELYGSVLAEQQAEFHELFEKNKVRLREQVILTLHDAESKDLSDAGLGLIKRQILEKTNRALGQPLLREVLFSKFNFIER